MRIKTSISLPEEQLAALDRLGENRSRLIEQAVAELLERQARKQRYQRELLRMKKSAARVNREMAEALEAQAPLWD